MPWTTIRTYDRYQTSSAYWIFNVATRAAPFMDAMVALDLDSYFPTLFTNSYPLRIELEVIKKIIESVSHFWTYMGKVPHIYYLLSYLYDSTFARILSFVTRHRPDFGSDISCLILSLASWDWVGGVIIWSGSWIPQVLKGICAWYNNTKRVERLEREHAALLLSPLLIWHVWPSWEGQESCWRNHGLPAPLWFLLLVGRWI